jgi:hypothetical protein
MMVKIGKAMVSSLIPVDDRRVVDLPAEDRDREDARESRLERLDDLRFDDESSSRRGRRSLDRLPPRLL